MAEIPKYNFGQRIADGVANVVGSWPFIITQSLVLAVWITWNNNAVKKYQFDPAPYVLMNLVLSTQAAFATPLILMSQRRQSEIDRQRDIETHSHAKDTLLSTIHIIEELETLEEKLHIMENEVSNIDAGLLEEDLLT
jgi:uncharacterized membrane protein